MYGCCPELGGWYWGRAEWHNRGTVHFHYLARMNSRLSDPYKLAANCSKKYCTYPMLRDLNPINECHSELSTHYDHLLKKNG